jgi:hypothetical protein
MLIPQQLTDFARRNKCQPEFTIFLFTRLGGSQMKPRFDGLKVASAFLKAIMSLEEYLHRRGLEPSIHSLDQAQGIANKRLRLFVSTWTGRICAHCRKENSACTRYRGGVRRRFTANGSGQRWRGQKLPRMGARFFGLDIHFRRCCLRCQYLNEPHRDDPEPCISKLVIILWSC